jgi:NAD-dependent DNA ligase
MSVDPHGQPFNIRFNRARRAERDLSELLGLAKGMLSDGCVSASEAGHLRHWLSTHRDACEQWPVNRIAARLEAIYSDEQVDHQEQRDLAELLEALVGGKAGIIVGEDAPTELPLDAPPPRLIWPGSLFVFTGKFAFGPRASCQRKVQGLGATCGGDVTRDTTYLVIGTFGSRDWVHTSFGRKIEKAVTYRAAGVGISIIAEEHWAREVDA